MLLRPLIVSGFLIVASAANAAAQSPEIEGVIQGLMTAIDTQNGPGIAAAFDEDAALLATTPDGNGIVVVTTAAFAEMHASGSYGGQPREVTIQGVDIADNLIANARVTASNATVHYTYYLGLVRLDGQWKIHSLIQRSRRID